jgi:hypothetical protein
MIRTAIIASLLAALSTAASAADFNGAKAVCADAIAGKQGKSLDGARTKLVKARDGATLRVVVEVAYPDGARAKGECRVRRGELQSVELAA